ncbi:MAG: hypothetical protein GC160_18960 [Acidobacteria bacterium]|nr:hypothetical protein [Acidobacteriota bacterium]
MARTQRSPRAREAAPQPASKAPSQSPPPSWGPLVAILLLAAFLRLWRLLDAFPIVGDEAIYLRWAEIIDHQGQWLISLLDGKQPLSYWIYAVERMLFAGADPLWMGRLVSAAAGVATAALLYAIGERLADRRAGLLAAALYAVFPWGVMYDRLVYTEALVNLAGAAVVLVSLWAFEPERAGWRRAALVGLALGLGYLLKSTALQYASAPVLIAAWKLRPRWAEAARLLAIAFAVAALFPIFCILATPAAPTLETHSLVLHSTNFFVHQEDFLKNPFVVLPQNLGTLGEYLGSFLTWPATAALAAALAYLAWRRSAAGLLLVAVSGAALLFQTTALVFFPSRYPFPQMWPLLVALAIAASDLARRLPSRRQSQALLAGFAVVVVLPMLARSLGVVLAPRESIWPSDARYYFGVHAHNGAGMREAIEFLRAEAAQGPLVVLVDPIWGLPADGVFPYLNQWKGARVYEAWWTTEPGQPILPRGEAEVIRSHYERVSAGTVDFRTAGKVYYLTATNYHPRAEVQARQPGARLALSTPKGDGSESLDLWRLR